jgi:hypothetical protein
LTVTPDAQAVTAKALNDFCATYWIFLQDHGVKLAFYFLIAALIAASVSAVLDLVLSILKKSTPGQADAALANAPSLISALMSLVTALASAPAWFGMFLAGFALLWLSGYTMRQTCGPALPPAPFVSNTAGGNVTPPPIPQTGVIRPGG